MKNIFLLLGLFYTILIFSQNNIREVEIIKITKDTIHVKMNFAMIKHENEILVNEDSFFKKVKIVDDNGKKLYTIDPSEILQLSFLDLDNKKRIYHKDRDRNQLMYLLYSGKIRCYKQFVPMNYYVGVYYLFLQPNGSPFKVGLFENNVKILSRITSSKPELKNKIESMKNEQDIVNILTEFEK